MSPMGRRPTWPAGRKNSFEFSFFLHICLPIAPALQLWQAASHKEIHRADEILYCQKEKGRPLTLCLVFYALFFRLPPRVQKITILLKTKMYPKWPQDRTFLFCSAQTRGERAESIVYSQTHANTIHTKSMARKKEKEKKKNVKYRFQKLFSLSIVFSEPWSIDIFRTSYNFISWNSLGDGLIFWADKWAENSPPPMKKAVRIRTQRITGCAFFFFSFFQNPV